MYTYREEKRLTLKVSRMKIWCMVFRRCDWLETFDFRLNETDLPNKKTLYFILFLPSLRQRAQSYPNTWSPNVLLHLIRTHRTRKRALFGFEFFFHPWFQWIIGLLCDFISMWKLFYRPLIVTAAQAVVGYIDRAFHRLVVQGAS